MLKHIFVFVTVGVVLAGCRRETDKLSLQGSTTVLPIVQKAADLKQQLQLLLLYY